MASYRYPLNITQDFDHYMTFVRYSYDSANLDIDQLKRADQVYKPFSPTAGIALPLPGNMTNSTSVNWTNGQGGDLASSATGAAIETVKGQAGGVGETVEQRTKISHGKVNNVFETLVFQSVAIKTNTFTWTLSPQNKAEADNIKDICLEFEEMMLPTVDDPWLKFPDLVAINIFGGFDYIKFAPTVLTNVDVSFPGGETLGLYGDANPLEVTLSISVSELSARNRDTFRGLHSR